ncbi:MAG: hypothetical protein ACRDG4_21540, partial [Chloroflexota bacterium]
MRNQDVARLAGVSLDEVKPASLAELGHHADQAEGAVLTELEKRHIGDYYRVGDRFFLDDASFGDVVAVEDLRMSKDLGLHD